LIQQTTLGPFTWDDPCWISAPLPIPLFNGATVQIQVFGERDDLTVLEAEEVKALQRFLALPLEHRLEVVPHLWRYYLDMRRLGDPSEIPEITDPATIWSHVEPYMVGVERDERGVPHVVIEAACAWEVEHGLQLVLQDGQRWVRVSDYTGHLTDGRAYGRSTLDQWINDPLAKLPVRGIDDLSTPQFGATTAKPSISLKWLMRIFAKR